MDAPIHQKVWLPRLFATTVFSTTRERLSFCLRPLIVQFDLNWERWLSPWAYLDYPRQTLVLLLLSAWSHQTYGFELLCGTRRPNEPPRAQGINDWKSKRVSLWDGVDGLQSQDARMEESQRAF